MGAIASLSWIKEVAIKKITNEVINPVLAALAELGIPFAGLLYPGLMERDAEFKVVEFNSRFGDPEAQVYMRLLKSDLYIILEACANGTLDEKMVVWDSRFAACVVLASGGYPDAYEKGKVITGIRDAEANTDVVVFHAGTKLENGILRSNGGRVLNVTATGDTLQQALNKAYATVDKINFEGKQFRTDIGQATLNKK